MTGQGEITVSVNHCVNTGRTYVYELVDGEIVAERVVEEAKR